MSPPCPVPASLVSRRRILRPHLVGALLGLLFLGVADGGSAAESSPYRQLPAAVREALAPRVRLLAADGSTALQQARLAGQSAPDTLRAVVLLCDFADSLLYGRVAGTAGPGSISLQSDPYYAAHDSLFFAHKFRDVSDYFDAVSGGRCHVVCTVVPTVANLPHPMGWYGHHPVRGEQPVLLAGDVVAALDPDVDFSRFDTVVIVHAGAGEETDLLGDSPEQVYSTYLSPEDFAGAVEDTILSQAFLPTNDHDGQGEPVAVDQVLVLPETEFQDPIAGFGGAFGSLGVYCFEVGLRLGMLSLSDFTPEGFPDSQGVGEFDLMGYGLFVAAGYVPDHPSAFNKSLMGWLRPYAVEPGSPGTYRLQPSESASGDSLAARVELGGREYWLLEYRLQDPDGNNRFSFTGDLNGNNVPDFHDADSANGDGTPTGFFDPATDVRERLTGAEWDFFMSENAARGAGVKAAGSGIYIWHVDEGLIEDLAGSPTNLFQADPKHKAIDLEEADGIQDLDSREASPFLLGGDADCYRGEGSALFGPDSVPDTRTVSGVPTGVRFDSFSNVVIDSLASIGEPPRVGIRFAEHMTFRCQRLDRATGPRLAAERVLPGVDLAGSHLMAVDLDVPPDGSLEIVAGGSAGEVLAFAADLSEHVDGDGAPASQGVLALGRDAGGAPARWCGAAAAGDLDGDGRIEVVLTAADGLYAFNGEDGNEIGDGDGVAASHGRVAALEGCALPPVLLRRDGGSGYEALAPVVAVVVEARGERPLSRMRWLDGAGSDVIAPLELGPGRVTAVPVPGPGGVLAVAVADTGEGGHALLLCRWPAVGGASTVIARLPLAQAPAPFPPTAVSREGLQGATVVGSGGRAETVWWDDTGMLVRRDVWPDTRAVGTPVVYGACGGAGDLALLSPAGTPLDGWPVRPREAVDFAPAGNAPGPLWAASTAAGPPDLVLFPARDGRLFLLDRAGRAGTEQPLAGPSAAVATPVWTSLVSPPDPAAFSLVAVGSFPRIVGRDASTGELSTEPVTRLAVWSGFAPLTASWPMWQGNPWRAPAAVDAAGPVPVARLFDPASALCYPSPWTHGPLHVRGEFAAGCLVRAELRDLAGEVVARSDVVAALPGGPTEVLLEPGRLASGVYICRLVAERDGMEPEAVTVPVAVAR